MTNIDRNDKSQTLTTHKLIISYPKKWEWIAMYVFINKVIIIINLWFVSVWLQERLTVSGHGSLALSGSSPGYGAGGSGGHHHRGASAVHHGGAMQHQLPQPDFQPPYFPPPFHHPPSPPPQQHLEYLTDPYGGLSGLHHYNQLGLRRETDPNHTHVVSFIH